MSSRTYSPLMVQTNLYSLMNQKDGGDKKQSSNVLNHCNISEFLRKHRESVDRQAKLYNEYKKSSSQAKLKDMNSLKNSFNCLGNKIREPYIQNKQQYDVPLEIQNTLPPKNKSETLSRAKSLVNQCKFRQSTRISNFNDESEFGELQKSKPYIGKFMQEYRRMSELLTQVEQSQAQPISPLETNLSQNKHQEKFDEINNYLKVKLESSGSKVLYPNVFQKENQFAESPKIQEKLKVLDEKKQFNYYQNQQSFNCSKNGGGILQNKEQNFQIDFAPTLQTQQDE